MKSTTIRLKPIHLLALIGALVGSVSLMLALSMRRRAPRTLLPVDVGGGVVPPAIPKTADKASLVPTAESSLPTVSSVERASREARMMIAAACTLMALVLVVVSALLFQPGEGGDARVGAAAWVALGGVGMLGLALRFAHLPPLPFPTLKAVTLPPVRWWGVGAGAAALVALGEINGNRFNIALLQSVSIHVQFALLFGGATLVTWGMSGKPNTSPHPLAPSPSGRRGTEVPRPQGEGFRVRAASIFTSDNRREALLVLAILAAALLVRAWQLGTLIHFPVDEMHMIEAVNDLRQNPNTPVLTVFNPFATYTWTFPYTQYLGSALFGSTFTGLRAPSVFFGVLAVLGVYLLGRALFNRATAVVAALLLLAFPPHLHFSRIGLTLIIDIPFGALAFAFLARGLFQQGRNPRADYALAGALFGIAQYCSEGGRILYLALMIAWLLALAALNPRLIWNQRKGLATMIVTGLLIALPVYYAWHALGYSFTPRLDQFTAWQTVPKTFAEYYDLRLKAPLMHFLHQPDTGSFYSGQTPLITVFIAPFFLFGLGYTFWRALPARGKTVAPGALLLPGWILGTIIGTSFLQDNGWTPRFVVAAPAIVLLAAVAIVDGLALLIPKRSGESDQTRAVLAAGVTVALVVAQVYYYFGAHLLYFNNRAGLDISFRPYPDFYDVAFRAALLPPNTQVFLVTDDEVRLQDFKELHDYWEDAREIVVALPDMLTPDVIFGLPDDKNYAFFIEPQNQRLAMFLRGRFPSLSSVAFSPFNVPTNAQYVLYFAPLENQSESSS